MVSILMAHLELLSILQKGVVVRLNDEEYMPKSLPLPMGTNNIATKTRFQFSIC